MKKYGGRMQIKLISIYLGQFRKVNKVVLDSMHQLNYYYYIFLTKSQYWHRLHIHFVN